MFAIFCKRVSPKCNIFVRQQFWAPQNAVLVKSFSSRKSSPSVCENDSDKSFTVSYLVNLCGLSSKDAISVSKKVCFKSSIGSLVTYQSFVRNIGMDKLAVNIDRAVEMGFDISKSKFIHALQVFVDLSESTLKHKMEVYRKCGWSESDIIAAFLSFPLCMKLSEKKIMANMDFLVNELGCKPVAIAECPVLLGLSLDKRIKPRCLVARILSNKGVENMINVTSLLMLSEKRFVIKRYIVKYEEDIPQLFDIYQGKLSLPEN